MLKPIHIDRVQNALDIVTGSAYEVDEVDHISLMQHGSGYTYITLRDSMTDYVADEDVEADIADAIKQLYGGDVDEVLGLDVNLRENFYEVASRTDILVPGATNPDQVYTERRIGRVLR